MKLLSTHGLIFFIKLDMLTIGHYDTSKNMKSFEDFLLVVISGYIVAAASSDALNCVKMVKTIVSKSIKLVLIIPLL